MNISRFWKLLPAAWRASLLLCFILGLASSAGQTPAGPTPSVEPMPPQGRMLTLNGMSMYVEVYGDGPPLLLVHGFGTSSQIWRPFIGELAKSHRVIAPDLRGHGWSTNPGKQWTHKQAAADLFALLDQLNVGPFKAIGVSNGGTLLLQMSLLQPDRLESMIVVGGAPYLPEETRAFMRNATVENMTTQDWDAARQIHKHGDEQIRLLRMEFNSFKDNVDDVNLTPPMLAKITSRVLLIQGDRDPFLPLSMAFDLRRAIPHSFLWIVPNGGPAPIFEVPAQFLPIAADFLKS